MTPKGREGRRPVSKTRSAMGEEAAPLRGHKASPCVHEEAITGPSGPRRFSEGNGWLQNPLRSDSTAERLDCRKALLEGGRFRHGSDSMESARAILRAIDRYLKKTD